MHIISNYIQCIYPCIKIKEDTNLRIKINGQTLNMLHFADNIPLIAENEKKLGKINQNQE